MKPERGDAKTHTDLARIALLSLLIIALSFVGLVLPLLDFIALDGDTANYSSHITADNISNSFNQWGIYRILAIFLKSVFFNTFDFSGSYLQLSSVATYIARSAFIVAVIYIFGVGKRYFLFVFSGAICNVFFLDVITSTSRSLNDLIACSIAILFIYLASKEYFAGLKMVALAFVFVFIGLIGYESYIIYSFVLLFALKEQERFSIFFGVGFGLFSIYLMNKYGFLLAHPKLSSTPNVVSGQALPLASYAASKFDQFLVSVSGVTYQIALTSIFVGLALYLTIYLSFGSGCGRPKRGEKEYGRSLSAGLLIIFGGALPMLLGYSIGYVGPHGSKLQWLLISGSIFMTSIGLVVINFGSIIVYRILSLIFTSFFGVSVLMVNQLAVDLHKNDFCKIRNGLFRNIPTLNGKINERLVCSSAG